VTSEPEAGFVSARAAAGVLFLDEYGRVLLIEPSYKDYLDLPGGYVASDETPSAAAAREVREELAIEPPIGRLLVADWRQDNIDDIGGAKILFVFDGGHLPAAHRDQILTDGHEVIGYAFQPVDQLAEVTIPRLANRIAQAVAARHSATIRYLENGQLIEGEE
jgi:8-oxo-dGTP diphosphatase